MTMTQLDKSSPVITRIDDTDPARIATLALAALGATRHAVAQSLTAAGFTGLVGSCEACPVARYLMASDPRLTGVAVSEEEICLDRADESVYLTTPGPVAAFLTRFDAHAYPHLIASSLPSPADPGTTARSEDRS
jgi:hypothetical protein